MHLALQFFPLNIAKNVRFQEKFIRFLLIINICELSFFDSTFEKQ